MKKPFIKTMSRVGNCILFFMPIFLYSSSQRDILLEAKANEAICDLQRFIVIEITQQKNGNEEFESFLQTKMQSRGKMIGLENDAIYNQRYWSTFLSSAASISSTIFERTLDFFGNFLDKDQYKQDIAQLFNGGHETKYFEDNECSLLHQSVNNAYLDFFEKSLAIKNKNKYGVMSQEEYMFWKMQHFMALLVFYKKHKLCEHIQPEDLGPAGLPYDSYRSTPLQYAWLQDYLYITREQEPIDPITHIRKQTVLRNSYRYEKITKKYVPLHEKDLFCSKWEMCENSDKYEGEIRVLTQNVCYEMAYTVRMMERLREVGCSADALEQELESSFAYKKPKDAGKGFKEFVKKRLEVFKEEDKRRKEEEESRKRLEDFFSTLSLKQSTV